MLRTVLLLLIVCPLIAADLPGRKRPSWINDGLVFVGNWEPLQWAYRKNWQNWGNGRAGAQAEAIHREEHSEATVAGLKKLGVNMVLTSFHKGFGIKNEKFNMDEAREYGKLLHKHGMKLGVYVSALLLYEELYAEYPEAKNWHRILYDGTPDTYGNDGYRYRAFLNHPEYLNYMKRVCELAVAAGADLIHFDTVSQTPENFHPLAEQMFRDWLKKKYPTTEGWFFRTGLHIQDFVKIPHYPNLAQEPTFDQPIMQEYLHFKSELLSGYAAQMAKHIKSLNPECAVEFNPHGITGPNRVLMNSVDHETLLPWLDAYWSEEPNHAEYTEDGRLISKIRSMKVGEQYNSLMFSYTSPLPTPRGTTAHRTDARLLLAEAMAFNRRCLGDLGTPLDYKTLPRHSREYVAAFWKRFDLFRKGESAATVAVLRSFASMAFNNFATHRETMLAEQTLIQSRVPFDIIDDHNLADLKKYQVVVLANQESLSDDQIKRLREYAKAGGGIVATADTAAFNEWRREREPDAFPALFGLLKGANRAAIGAGRVVYLPSLIPSVPVPPRTVFTNRYWAPAKNREAFLEALRWASGSKPAWEIDAPDFVVVNALRQTDRGRYVLHVINYNAPRQPEVAGILIRAAGSGMRATSKAVAWSPDDSTEVELQISRTPDGISVTLPKLHVYSVITLAQ